jgi:rhodanese-related sulfurtransferase
MIQFFINLTTNQRLAVLAFVLGLGAIAATPTRGSRVSVDSREMALLLETGADRVPVRTLAEWIIQARSDFRLVDLRSPAAFAAGPRIPSAENIPIAALSDAGLARDEKILLVADDDVRAAQAWFLLVAQGYKGAYIVEGGLRGWYDQVVYPRLDGTDPAQRAQLEAMSAHFGGAPRTGAASDALNPVPAPEVAQAVSAAPLLPAATGAKKPAPAKKKEGC